MTYTDVLDPRADCPDKAWQHQWRKGKPRGKCLHMGPKGPCECTGFRSSPNPGEAGPDAGVDRPRTGGRRG